jgi:inorganic pyrophosphatase
MNHPWHEIKQPENWLTANELLGVIEISRGSKVKYELDKETGMLLVDRILSSAVHYPENYGFFPQTYCDDKDPLDVLVISQESFVPMSLCHVRPIGVMKMIDKGELDDKIIAVHVSDPYYKECKNLTDICSHRIAEIKQFFLDYKILEKKVVQIEDILGVEEAKKIITESLNAYKLKFGK